MSLSLQSDAADQTATTSGSAALVSPTPLASSLLQQEPALLLAPYCGADTPARFTEPAAELDALLSAVAVYDLGYRSHIAVTGSDRLRWLNGMVTNTVTGLAPGEGNLSFVLSAQGRIQADANIFHPPVGSAHAGALLLDTTRSQSTGLLELLDRFIIMDDVELSSLDADLSAIGIAGPRAAATLQALGLPGSSLAPLHLEAATWQGHSVTVVAAHSPLVPRFELWIEPGQLLPLWKALIASGAAPAGCLAIEQLRILEGTPLYGTDIRNRDLPQETGQARALHFAKGCYVGQEIVERIRSRGNVHRVFSAFTLVPDTPGEIPALPAPLTAMDSTSSQPAGELTSVTRVRLSGATGISEQTIALGYIRREVLERATIQPADPGLRYPSGKAAILRLPISLPLAAAAAEP